MKPSRIARVLLGSALMSAPAFASTATEAPDWLNHLALHGHVSSFTGVDPLGHQPFMTLIDQAQSSVFMEMYHLTDEAVVSKLTDAAKRGVGTRVILDQGGLKSTTGTAIENELRASSVSVAASSPAFSITHTKSLIVDNQTAIVSSMNLTEHPETRRDYGVIVEDPAVIREMNSVFEADLKNSADQTALTPDLENPNLVWSPVNSRSKLHDLIGSATTSIDAVAENVFDDEVIADLISAEKRGVVVRVISPACPLGQKPDRNFTAAQTLHGAGVDARQMPDPATTLTPYQHGKMMVIDSKRAYVGSINYSFNSIMKARELGIVLEDAGAIANLDQAFTTDFSHAIATSSVPECGATSNAF